MRIAAPRRLIPGAVLAAAIALLGEAARAMPPIVAAFESAFRESQLTFMCGSDRMWLAISGAHESWGGNPAAEIPIGSRTFRLRAVALHDTLLLSDEPAPGKGVSRSLVSAAKSGRTIELTGLASKALRSGLRAFWLAHARAEIENVEKSCGLAPTR